MATIETVAEMSVFELADWADCLSPDKKDSPGAKLLDHTRTQILYRIKNWRESNPDASLVEVVDALDEDYWQVADEAPSIYTHERWQEFVDLGAYQEEPEISGVWPKDLTEAAGYALYQIADRLARRIAQEIADSGEDA
jgi:hypothetical protein